MSALGHKRTYAVRKGMSALPPKATLKAFFRMYAKISSLNMLMSATDDEIVAQHLRVNQESTNQFLKKYLFANETEKRDSNFVFIIGVTFLITELL
jgi:hypothetical protein